MIEVHSNRVAITEGVTFRETSFRDPLQRRKRHPPEEALRASQSITLESGRGEPQAEPRVEAAQKSSSRKMNETLMGLELVETIFVRRSSLRTIHVGTIMGLTRPRRQVAPQAANQERKRTISFSVFALRCFKGPMLYVVEDFSICALGRPYMGKCSSQRGLLSFMFPVA